MASMRALQPKMKALQDKYKEDKPRLQQEMLKLYQEEKVNPMAGLGGCAPMLLQLPVFWALYKVLQLAIEMRHAPFFGWIKDLSAPDTTTIINLFGLLPFHPADVPMIGTVLDGPLHIGVIAILYGCSMWLSQQMSPTTGMDPNQRMMMAFMPLIMVFFFSQLAIGLMVYYFWNNILTILQQYSIMRRLKVENPDDDLLYLSLVYTVFVVIAALLLGRLSDSWGRRKPFVTFAAILQAVAAIMLALVPSFPVAMVAGALLGLGYGCFLAVDQALATQVLPDAADRGKDLGIMNIASAVPQAVAPLLGAFVVVSLGGFTGLFLLSGLVALLGAATITPIRTVQ